MSPFSLAPTVAGKAADGRHDFDFFVGRWRCAHRRLRRRLAGDTRWDEFAGTSEMRPLLGGLANVDDNVIELPGGTYGGTSVRAFDPSTKQWSIWWIDSRHNTMEPPVTGSFKNGVGSFYGDDTFEGRPIRVRFLWSEITANSCRWEQAFSTDAGASWEINWTMEFTRMT